MNERVRELAEQATYVEAYYPAGNDGHPEYRIGFNKEKFAELIVKECGHCMVDIMLHGGIEPEQGYDIMLKRFGVE